MVKSLASILAVAIAAAAPVTAAAAAPPHADDEARISLDVKDAEIGDIVRLLAEVTGYQVVLDPGISCKLTLRLKEVRAASALDVALRSCGLSREEENGILRIATAARLTAEAADRRKLEEEKRLAGPLVASRFRLSYARAAEMAPLVKRFLSPRGEVTYDARTNTLIVIDVDVR
jgi:type IV pilus assembly protein PilQ